MKDNRIDAGIKRAALYIRVSHEDQAKHGVSLDAQRATLLRYAQENDLVVVDVYADEGVTARKRFTTREQFMRMLSDIEQKKIDVVLFIKLDRLTRSVPDYYEIQRIFDKHRVQWVATEERYDTTTANGRLNLNIKLTIAQDESDRTGERIKFTNQNLVREGRVITGKMPRGYQVVDKRPEIDPEQADLVRALFNHFLECRSKAATVKWCIDTYGVYIDAKAMKKLLTCTWYIGEAYGIKGYCPRILDDDTFNRSVELINVRAQRNGYDASGLVYYFTGMVYCGCCGRKMTSYSAKYTPRCKTQEDFFEARQKYTYYRCPAHLDHRCENSKNTRQEVIEQWLLDHIETEAKEHNLAVNKKRKPTPSKKIDTAKINAKLGKLKDLYLNDLITRDSYEKDYRQLTDLLREAEEAELPKTIRPLDITYIAQLLDLYDDLKIENKKAFWSRIIKKIIVDENGNLSVVFSS